MTDSDSPENPGKNQTDSSFDRDELNAPPVFYYSRERRLNRASPIVRSLNEGKTIRPSLSKSLFATRGNMFIFASVILILAVSGLAFRFSRADRGGISLGKNSISVIITQEEDILFLDIIKKAPKNGDAYTGPVEIAVSPVMPKTQDGTEQEIPPVFSHRIIFRPVDSEISRTSLPFEGSNFFVILRTPDEQKSLRLKAVVLTQ